MMSLRKERGFSLVELMIVVAIIAILAAIAIPSFMRFAMKSKTSEATGNLSAIRTAEEGYKAENDTFYDCVESPADADMNGSSPVTWSDEGVVGTSAFGDIGFEPDGDVRYQYTVQNSTALVFEAVAEGDLDDDGVGATFTITKGNAGYPKPVKGGDDY